MSKAPASSTSDTRPHAEGRDHHPGLAGARLGGVRLARPSAMYYGGNIAENWRSAAAYVDRILKGAKPGDLPVQRPTKYDFAINLKTAQALGLTIPPSVLQQATELIQ
jgi:hypothetical protein